MRCNDLKNRCTVCHIFCYRSDLIQRRTVSDQSVTGNGSVGRLNTCHTTEGAWLTDGSARIGTKCIEALSCCNSRTGSAGRSSRYMLGVPWVLCLAEGRCLGGASHGKLVHICLSKDHGSCLLQIKHCLGCKCRYKIS